MLLVTSLLMLVACAAAARDWRKGLFVAVPVALIQDPLRKLTPGEPVFFVVLVGVVLGISVLAALKAGISLMPTKISGWRRYLLGPSVLFIMVISLQAVNSYLRFGNIILPAIGALFFLTPFVALTLVYQSIVRSDDDYILNFMRLYVVCAGLMLTTVYLDYIGIEWKVLGEVGQGITIYDFGYAMSAFSGFFRSSEVAAWHAATVAIFLIIMLLSQRGASPEKLIFVAVLVLAVVGLGALTGRRKFIMEIVIFISAYIALLSYFGRGGGRVAVFAAIAGAIAALSFDYSMPDEEWKLRSDPLAASYEVYVDRSKTVFQDVPERFTKLGIAPITWAYNRFGLLGAGLGVGSQGTQHFSGVTSAASEGGLGKIWVELGAPGFIVLAWFSWALARHLWRILSSVALYSQILLRLSCGLTSFLLANAANFIVASQVYGDLFVLMLIGMTLASLLSMPVFIQREIQRRSPMVAVGRSREPSRQLASPIPGREI